MDNATPSANSIAAVGLLRLAALTGEQRYANHAEQILRLLGPVMPPGTRPRSRTCWPPSTCVATGITEVAVVGDRPDLVAAVRDRWLPNAVLAWGDRTSRRCGSVAVTGSPTCAATTPAWLRRTPSKPFSPNSPPDPSPAPLWSVLAHLGAPTHSTPVLWSDSGHLGAPRDSTPVLWSVCCPPGCAMHSTPALAKVRRRARGCGRRRPSRGR